MFKRNLVLVGALGLAGAVHGTKTLAAADAKCEICGAGGGTGSATTRSSCASGNQCNGTTNTAVCKAEVADGTAPSPVSSLLCASATAVADSADSNKCTVPSELATDAVCVKTSTATKCKKNVDTCVGSSTAGTKCTAITYSAATTAGNQLHASAAWPASAYITTAASGDAGSRVSPVVASCAEGLYVGAADGGTATNCEALVSSSWTNASKCIRTVVPGTGAAEDTVTDNCGTARYCSTTGGTLVNEKATASGGLGADGIYQNPNKKSGVCLELETANGTAPGGHTDVNNRTYGCASSLKKDESGKCQTALTLDAVVTAVYTGTCKTAIDALTSISGHSLDTTWKTDKPSAKTNCYQIVEEDMTGAGKAKNVFWPSTTAKHKGTSGKVPECGLCSDECVGAIKKVSSACSAHMAKYLYQDQLPFLVAIATVEAAIGEPVRGTKSPCLKTSKWSGCDTAAGHSAYKSDWSVSSSTASPATDKITAFKSACAVAYDTGAATAKFAGATILASAVVILSIFA